MPGSHAEAGLGPPVRTPWTPPLAPHRHPHPVPWTHVSRVPWPCRADQATGRPLASRTYPPHVVVVPCRAAPHTATIVLARKATPPPLLAFKSWPPSPHAQGALAEPPSLPWVATRSSTRRSRSRQPALPVLPLGPPVASPPSRCLGRAPGSPEPKLQRRPPPAFAVPLADGRRRPKPAPKSVLRSP
jgi:hypothetical protein